MKNRNGWSTTTLLRSAAPDGTTTATVLAQSIVVEGHKAIAAGMNFMTRRQQNSGSRNDA